MTKHWRLEAGGQVSRVDTYFLKYTIKKKKVSDMQRNRKIGPISGGKQQ